MKKMLPKTLLVLLILVVSTACFSQTGVVRLEFPAEIGKTPYEIVPLGPDGLLFFNAQNEMMSETSRSWYFAQYDSNLVRKWEARVPVPDGAVYQRFQQDSNKVFLFFINTGKVKSGSENYQLSELELSTGIINHYTGLLPEVSEVKGFLVSGGVAAVACDMRDEQASVFFIDFKSKTVNQYTCDFPDQNFIGEIRKDAYSDSLFLVIANYEGRRQSRLVLVTLSMTGALSSSHTVEAVLPSKYLNTARVFPAGPGVQLLAGSYSNFASKIQGSSEYYGIESAGFFVTQFYNGEQQYMNYYNFLELQNLRPAISAKDYLKLSRKKEREEPDYSADYELMLYPVQQVGGQYVVLAESFYPDFRTVSDISYDYWGRPITHTYTVFEGYRVFQALLLGFDLDGRLLWDNSLDLSSISTQDLSQRSGYIFEGKPAVLFTNDGSKISYRAYAENAVIEGMNYTELDTSERGDKVVELGDNFMVNWYGNKFLCYGYHTVRNNLMVEKEKRTVFYINKVSLE